MGNINGTTFGIYTLGCKVNQYESEAISEALSGMGLICLPTSRVCDIYIINTCTVTSESDRKARQFIRRAKAQNPNARILVTGCYAQRSPDEVSAIGGLDFICGTRNKLEIARAVERLLMRDLAPFDKTEICTCDVNSSGFEKMSIDKFDRTRAYVKIEDGCDSHCTYCAIRKARGCVASKPLNDTVNEVERLTKMGCREVVLTGIEVSAYGKDLEPATDLSDLLLSIDRIDGIGRVRLGSLDPSLFKQSFIDKISSLSSLAPHFHISLQSGSSNILALMKRKYNRDMALDTVKRLRAAFPTLQLTTDIIVGFPGEREQDFEDTLSLIKEANFLTVHVFPYSKRKGTEACDLPCQIDEAVKKQRVDEVSRLSSSIRASILDSTVSENKRLSVLFENSKDGYFYGHTPEFIEVRVKSRCDLHARVCAVRPISHDGNVILGEIIEN